MPIKFETNAQNYKGAREWKANDVVKDVRILTEHLPFWIDTKPFQPYMVQRQNRYAVMVDFRFEADNVIFQSQTKPVHELRVSNVEFDMRGLPITLVHVEGEPSGVIFNKK